MKKLFFNKFNLKSFMYAIIFILIILFLILFNEIITNYKKYEDIKNGNIFSNNNNISQISFDEYENQIYQKIDFLLSNKKFKLELSNSSQIIINNKKYSEKEWQLPFLNYYESNQKPTAFIDQWNDYLFIVSGRGDIIQIDFENIKNNFKNIDDINVNKINNNLSSIIDDENFYGRTWISIKDLLIDNDDIYISYTKKYSQESLKKINIENPEHEKIITINDDSCYGLSILKAKINDNFLNFKNFIDLQECVYSSTPEFTAHLVGGRLVSYGSNLLLSTGDFRTRSLSQKKNSYFGKIILINKLNKDLSLFSVGHRNPQGLFYDKENDIILSTEHGPWGGDEINIIYNNKNYGWPVSSYGKHYCEKKQPLEDECIKKYKDFPLYKSHIDYGYVEPIKYFEKSFGISELIKLPKKFSNNNRLSYLVSSLGGEIGRQFYTFDIKKNDKSIFNESFIPSKERVRDLRVSENGEFIFLIKEDTSKFSIIY